MTAEDSRDDAASADELIRDVLVPAVLRILKLLDEFEPVLRAMANNPATRFAAAQMRRKAKQ